MSRFSTILSECSPSGRKTTRLTKNQRFRLRYRYDFASFVQDCIEWRDGEAPASYQVDALRLLIARRRLAVRSLHGVGKTALSAWAILAFALTREGEDFKIITTASVYRQLERYLWPEVHKWTKRLRWERIGRPPFSVQELQQMSIKLIGGSAFAVPSEDPARMEGAHADSLLYVFDEAKSVSSGAFDAAEGAFSNAWGESGKEAFALAISTPGAPSGRFYEISSRKPGFSDWTAYRVTLETALASGKISSGWVEARRAQWGGDSAIFRRRVLGEFAQDDESALIPVDWVEAAFERWSDWSRDLSSVERPIAFGVDVARKGNDQTVICAIYPTAAEIVYKGREPDLTQTAARIAALSAQNPGALFVIDEDGVGGGLLDQIAAMGVPCQGFIAQSRVERRDETGFFGFANRRSWGWYSLRERLRPDAPWPFALKPDDGLLGDLTAPDFRIRPGGIIEVESKDQFRRRLGMNTDGDKKASPDCGDALMMGLTAEPFRSDRILSR